jgi:hypothetical protein
MTAPVINSWRDPQILVDIEWIGETLRKCVHNVIVRVGAIVELCPKRRLPFLGLHAPARIRIVNNEALEIEFPQLHHLRTHFEIRIREIANAIRPLQETDGRIEIRSNFSVLGKQV